MKAAIYSRVSTLDQSVSMQLDELRKYVATRGWELVCEFVDVGVSGSKEKRPELDKLMAAAHKGRFDVVIVWKLDRFARSLKHLVVALSEFEAMNVAFVSLTDNLDLSTPQGRLMFHVIGAMSEFERSLIIGRTKSGMAAAKARGAKIGRPSYR